MGMLTVYEDKSKTLFTADSGACYVILCYVMFWVLKAHLNIVLNGFWSSIF